MDDIVLPDSYLSFEEKWGQPPLGEMREMGTVTINPFNYNANCKSRCKTKRRVAATINFMESKLVKGLDYVAVGVSFFVHDGKGNFVMSKRGQNARDEHGKWDIGGGGIDFGKTVEEALRDEIKEEYCADILKADFLGYSTTFREQNGRKTHWIHFDFKVLVDHSAVKNGEPHKLDAVEWFTFKTLPDNLHSQVSIFFKTYQDTLQS